jgi:hypothetical protein
VNISYTYKVVSVDTQSNSMVVSYSADGYSTVSKEMRLPLSGLESTDDVINTHAPVPFWETEKAVAIAPPVGFSGSLTVSDVVAELSVNELRLDAYSAESDPIFFKAQRGEATLQEWQDKIAEIKARYPKPD